MSLTRPRSQSHQLIPTHTFTIQNAQRVTYDQKLCPYCDHQAIGNEIHILLQCPGTKHIANDLVATLTTLLTQSLINMELSHIVPTNVNHACRPPHDSSQKNPPNMASRYPPPHSHIHSSPRNTLVQHTTHLATPLAQSPLCPS